MSRPSSPRVGERGRDCNRQSLRAAGNEMPMTHDGTEAAPNLVRELGLLDATMIVMGSMIGSGIFITSAESARLVGSPGWLLAAWALAGVLTITGALCCAE